MERVLGDVNGDNRITKIDLLLIQAHLMGKITLNEEQLLVADVTGDGYVTIEDMVAVSQHLNGKNIITEVLIL